MTALTAERLAELRVGAEFDHAHYPYHWVTEIFPAEVLALLDEVERLRRLELCERCMKQEAEVQAVHGAFCRARERAEKAEAERDALQKRLDAMDEALHSGCTLTADHPTVVQLQAMTARAEKAEAALAKARVALTEIRDMPNDSLWMDDRDDAADCMVEIAHAALEAK